jgi:hypothetical protein
MKIRSIQEVPDFINEILGWGGRIRTSAWWNQNQPTLSMISTGILKKAWNTALKVSIG